MTCLIVTHNMQQAARMADRAIHLEAGRMIAIGPIDVKEMSHAR